MKFYPLITACMLLTLSSCGMDAKKGTRSHLAGDIAPATAKRPISLELPYAWLSKASHHIHIASVTTLLFNGHITPSHSASSSLTLHLPQHSHAFLASNHLTDFPQLAHFLFHAQHGHHMLQRSARQLLSMAHLAAKDAQGDHSTSLASRYEIVSGASIGKEKIGKVWFADEVISIMSSSEGSISQKIRSIERRLGTLIKHEKER